MRYQDYDKVLWMLSIY